MVVANIDFCLADKAQNSMQLDHWYFTIWQAEECTKR